MPNYLIFGATGGIGSSVARLAAARGSRVLLSGRDPDKLDRLASELNTESIVADVTDFEDVQRAISFAASALDGLDGIVNCVGNILLKPAHLTSIEDFDSTLRLNLYSAFYTVKAGVRALMSNGGSIVLCSSAVVRTGMVNHEAIAAAKGGIEGLIRSAAATYANRGIRINGVAPGLVETPLTERLTKNAASRSISEKMHPLGRLGTPDDVSRALDWLLDGTKSSWVTGQILGVDGGLSSVRPR